jgi:vacuolar-type H+-ATPase subunit I/STV1
MISIVVGACQMIFSCIATSVKLERAPKKKGIQVVMSATIFLVSILIIFLWSLERKSFCDLFRIDASLEPKNGFKTKKFATSVQNAETGFSVAP